MSDAVQTAAMIPFVKAHANGNDFLVMDESFAKNQHAALAKKLCARNTSVGADGIEFLDMRPDGRLFLRLFNADGSEAELSGNGTRCVAAWLAFSEKLDTVVLGTHGGPRACKVVHQQGAHFEIESEMGVPWLNERTLEIAGAGAVQGAVVNVGNPHFVIFVGSEDFRSHDMGWQELGSILCTHPAFPQGTNVEFVFIRSASEIVFRIYERGCGPTTSSGTGTCASAAAAIALHGCARTLTAHAEGGSQSVVWTANDAQMKLTGPAEIICIGEVAGL
jgi:diaminopimelate epimerase